jgi:hypothetical protein
MKNTTKPVPGRQASDTHMHEKAVSGPFNDFIFKNRTNRKYWGIALAGIVLQFIVFKICYPFADFFSDSYTYISVAENHTEISFRPVGYSRFLASVHKFTTSDTALVFIQYLVLLLGALFLFFTIRYFFNPRRVITNLIFIFLVFNPVSLYISNMVCSDTLFIGLSFVFITQMLWIINRPAWHQFILLAIVLFFLFKLRYIALYYPVIPVFAFLLSRQRPINKIAGIICCILPVVLEAQRIKQLTFELTGTKVFSAFSGWMSANNALIIYPHAQVNPEDFPSEESVDLNNMAKNYFSTRVSSPNAQFVDFKFFWDKDAPLKQFMFKKWQQQSLPGYFEAWNAVAPTFSEFSSTVIQKNPGVFLKYFIWPNMKEYMRPFLETQEIYNLGKDSVDATAVEWFKYKTPRVRVIDKNIQHDILLPFTWFFGFINLVFCIGMIIFLLKWKKLSLPRTVLYSFLLIAFYWGINYASLLFAAPILFRFTLFSMYLYTTFALLLLHYLIPVKKTN